MPSEGRLLVSHEAFGGEPFLNLIYDVYIYLHILFIILLENSILFISIGIIFGYYTAANPPAAVVQRCYSSSPAEAD